MRQPESVQSERRADVRHPKAFAFWLRPVNGARRVSAWMLDMSAGGAAFLTAVDDAPSIGERIELIEMHTHDRLVREGAGPLPPFARVLRHDNSGGVTRRVAVRFESDEQACRRERVRRVAVAAAPESAVLPYGPPPVPANPLGGLQVMPERVRL